MVVNVLELIGLASFAGLVALVGIVLLPLRAQKIESASTHSYAVFLLVTIFSFSFVVVDALYNFVNSIGEVIRAHGSSCLNGASSSGLSIQSLISSGTNGARCGIMGQLLGSPALRSRTPREIAANNLIFWAIVLLIALSIVLVQSKIARGFYSNAMIRASSAGSVLSGYLFSVALVAVVIFAISAVGFLYSIVMIVAPRVTGVGGRSIGVQSFFAFLCAAGASDFLMWWHVKTAWRIQAERKGETSI